MHFKSDRRSDYQTKNMFILLFININICNYLYWFSHVVFHLDSSYCRCYNLVSRLLSFLATPWNKAFFFFFFFTELNTESNQNTTTWWKWRVFRLLLVWTKYSLWSGDGAFNGALKEMNTLAASLLVFMAIVTKS